jgi:hypothetical protein
MVSPLFKIIFPFSNPFCEKMDKGIAIKVIRVKTAFFIKSVLVR